MITKNYILEIWVPVRGYEGLYEVSNFGRVKSLERIIIGSDGRQVHYKEKIRVFFKNDGYNRVRLSKRQRQKNYLVHRLVWEAFNGPIPEGMQINHLDENPENNLLSNLSLVTPSQNNNWGSHIERCTAWTKTVSQKNRSDESKPVMQFTKDGVFIKEYPSIREAWRQTAISYHHIGECCKGRAKSAGTKGGIKYIWKYKSEAS